jgi:hypothetical protein
MRISRGPVLLGILCGAAMSCHNPTRPLAGCLGEVPISILSTRLVQPVGFEWTPACGVSSLQVTTVPGPGAQPLLVWALSAGETTPIGPRVVYGVTPRGATADHAALPLVHGVTYRVTVQYIVGGDAIAASGTEVFSY